MSCPHPRPPVERLVGSFSELVCPDCHARLAVADDPETIEGTAVEMPSEVMSRDEIMAVLEHAVALGILDDSSAAILDELADDADHARVDEDAGTLTVGYRGNDAVIGATPCGATDDGLYCVLPKNHGGEHGGFTDDQIATAIEAQNDDPQSVASTDAAEVVTT